MRLTRILVGLAILLIALWILVGEQLAGVSADATVNARLTSVRAPVAGDVSLVPLTLGEQVKSGDRLGVVDDPRPDAVRLDDLTMERGLEEATAARLRARIGTLEAEVAAMAERTLAYRAARVAEIEARLTHARARLARLEADPSAADSETAATLGQGETGNPGDPLLADVALEYARERVAVLEIELTSAKEAVFLGDGDNDASWSEQWGADLQARLAEDQSARAEAEARAAAVADRLDAERLRVNRLESAVLESPVNGVIWEMRAASGENVQRGDELLKLVDCGSVIVTVSVTEGVYNGLSIGDTARFRPRGGSATFEGTVARLAGAGAGTVYRNLAIAPSERHLQRFDVAVEVPGLAEDPDLACAIGRTGRVFFTPRPLDWLRRMPSL